MQLTMVVLAASVFAWARPNRIPSVQPAPITMQRVRLGMTHEEVAALLGPPTQKFGLPRSEFWNYGGDKGPFWDLYDAATTRNPPTCKVSMSVRYDQHNVAGLAGEQIEIDNHVIAQGMLRVQVVQLLGAADATTGGRFPSMCPHCEPGHPELPVDSYEHLRTDTRLVIQYTGEPSQIARIDFYAVQPLRSP
jgi:outer membrane protein assembly factor BamE (lipoprotein component of BamABCDE complex)